MLSSSFLLLDTLSFFFYFVSCYVSLFKNRWFWKKIRRQSHNRISLRKIEFHDQFQKIDFSWKSQHLGSRGPTRCQQPLWGSLGTSRRHFWPLWKNRFFEIFRIFLAGRVGFQNFRFWPPDPQKVDGTCPTQHFLTSWGSGEYVGSPVGHHRAGIRPLGPDLLQNSDHRLRWHFGGHATRSRPIFEIVPMRQRFFDFRISKNLSKAISHRNLSVGKPRAISHRQRPQLKRSAPPPQPFL